MRSHLQCECIVQDCFPRTARANAIMVTWLLSRSRAHTGCGLPARHLGSSPRLQLLLWRRDMTAWRSLEHGCVLCDLLLGRDIVPLVESSSCHGSSAKWPHHDSSCLELSSIAKLPSGEDSTTIYLLYDTQCHRLDRCLYANAPCNLTSTDQHYVLCKRIYQTTAYRIETHCARLLTLCYVLTALQECVRIYWISDKIYLSFALSKIITTYLP